MDLTNLRQRHEELVNHMKNAGYSRSCIYMYQRQIREILELDLESWASYQDIYQYFVSISSRHFSTADSTHKKVRYSSPAPFAKPSDEGFSAFSALSAACGLLLKFLVLIEVLIFTSINYDIMSSSEQRALAHS